MVPEVNEEFVLAKCNFFASTQVWPLKRKLDPEGWLGNFAQKDKRLACQLLNSFMYFSDDWLDRMFVSAVQGLSRTVTTCDEKLAVRRSEWRRFLDDAVFTFPTGERPFVGDSGHLFVRRARDLLNLDEAKVLAPEAALQQLVNRSTRTIVFVDDFVGTGQQFLKTWKRQYAPMAHSFESLANSQAFDAYYCPIFCTKYAIDHQLHDLLGKVVLAPAHWLTPEHGLFTDESIWWPDSMKPHAYDFIRKYSMQIGLPDTGGYDTRDWQGFNQLGLAISFGDCCPDATIPIFDTTTSGWRPLWKR